MSPFYRSFLVYLQSKANCHIDIFLVCLDQYQHATWIIIQDTWINKVLYFHSQWVVFFVSVIRSHAFSDYHSGQQVQLLHPKESLGHRSHHLHGINVVSVSSSIDFHKKTVLIKHTMVHIQMLVVNLLIYLYINYNKLAFIGITYSFKSTYKCSKLTEDMKCILLY